MRQSALLLVFSFHFISHAQRHDKPRPVTEWLPLYFLDSVNLETSQMNQVYFSADKVKTVNVVSNYYDSSKQIHGKVYITSKDPRGFKFLSIDDLTRTFKQDAEKPILYMLDNELLKSVSEFKIDSSYILKVEIIHSSELDYLKNKLPDMVIFKIITNTKENIDKQNRIMIRGAGKS